MPLFFLVFFCAIIVGMPTFRDARARGEADKNSTDASLAQADAKTSVASGTVYVGKIVRAGVGTYDFKVATGSGSYYSCSMLTKTSYMPFGYSESVVPLEGTTVLFVPSSDATGFGYIIGVVPGNPALNDGNDPKENSVNIPLQGYTMPYGPGMDTESIYSTPLSNAKGGPGYFGSYRPIDVFPGEYVLMNEHGVGIDGDMLTMAIRGGHASIAASRVDDTARIVCRNFRFYGSRGSTLLYTDSGCITEESTFSPYIGERTGGAGITQFRDPIEDDKKEGKTVESNDAAKSDTKKDPVIKARIRTFIGYLGGLFSVFMAKPDKNTDKVEPKTSGVQRLGESSSGDARRVDEKEPKDNGLLQLNVNDNGRVMFRSAGGFVLERGDRIPIPVRIRDFDSPGGVRSEDIEKKDILKFELPEDSDGNVSPHYMQLALNDKLAYDYRATYERFIELIPSMAKKDEKNKDQQQQQGQQQQQQGASKTKKTKGGDEFYLRNEEDLEKLEDDSGIPDRKVTPDDLEKGIGRRAGIYVLPSGEISIRDAWGSEILMTGGNIVINTPGSVKSNNGYSFIIQAGDDIVAKARHSVDIDATENDITVKGERNVRIVSGSDMTTDAGGIILESLSVGDEFSTPDPDDEDYLGEDASSTGIIIKASKSHVSLVGSKTIVGATEEVRVITGTEEDERDGQVNIATGQIGMTAEDGTMITSGNAGVGISSGAVSVVGNQVVVGGSNGVVFATSGQIGVPIWIDMKSDFVQPYLKRMQEYVEAAKKDDLNKPIKLYELQDSILFTYRTSEQCHTWNGYEFTDIPDQFTEYQPYWSVLAKMKVGTMKDVELEEWALRTVNGEYPWPGTWAIENGNYVMLDEDQATEDETYNTKKITVEVEVDEVDEKGNVKKKKENRDFVCSKKFDKIEGNNDDSENKMKVTLEDMNRYIVPVVSEQEKKSSESDDQQPAQQPQQQ
jgi:hypothetical protein